MPTEQVLGLYIKLPRKFGDIDLTLAKQLISLNCWALGRSNKKFMDGDHLQEERGVLEGWIGPMPQPLEPGYSQTKKAIKAGFTSRNVVKELVERHVNGLLGREPDWGFTLRRSVTEDKPITTEEQNLLDEAEAFVTTWWDNRKAHTYIKNVASSVLHQKRASMRLYVPPGRLVEVQVEDVATGQKSRKKGIAVQDGSMDQALDFIWIETPQSENSTVFWRQDDKSQVGLTIGINQKNGLEQLELTYLEKQRAKKEILTVLNLKNMQGESQGEFKFDLGGRLTMFEIEREPLITRQIQEGQRAINLTISVLPRAVITGGFLERILLNAQMPGSWVADPNAPDGKRFVPGEFKTGAGTTQFVSGIEHDDAETGVTKLMTPEVVYRDPVDTGTLIKTLRAQYQNMLEECDQVHILVSGDAMASGVAREQARVEFLLSLQKTQEVIEQLGRWMIETVLAMGEAFSGSPGKYTKTMKSYFHCRINAGAVSSDERAQYGNEVAEGRLSLETAMHLSGVDDVAAELQRIATSPYRKYFQFLKLGESLQALVTAGWPLQDALEAMDVPEDQIKNIVANAEKEKKAQQEQEMAMVKETAKVKADSKPKPVVKKKVA